MRNDMRTGGKDQRKAKGALGEHAAASFLENLGYRIIERNWRCRSGEMDLIAAQHDILVFIEVRSRSSSSYGTPAESITARKITQVRQTAAVYLHMNGIEDVPIRFDMISVRLIDETAVVTDHIIEAF
ncbi:YraN family protein [Paenibacillus sp. 23TSA30-6]|uniref:YraN family protein n=1 Tax=Paenibacillus sp. 23TSA30-6 TaxID=2546104 RepID=UPI0017879229|nr:YraN family protein [Paenibacillus sp. 23TSA30-6]MBE0335451.1 YraN family protein [Paenibacillus sp. 23TSA30-6]